MLTQCKPCYDGLKVTREEYLDLEEDGFKYDMIDGVLHMSPSAFYEHNKIIFNLNFTLGKYLNKIPIAQAAPETDVYLPDGDDVLRPDVTIILKENYGIIKGHIHGVPDIVIEVLSLATYKRDLGIKADRYLKNGVKEYWIIDPDEKATSIWSNEHNNTWKKKTGEHLESSVLPSFTLHSNEVFSK